MNENVPRLFLFVLADRGGYNFCRPVISELRQSGKQVMCLLAKKLDLSLKATDEDFGEYFVYSEQTNSLNTTLKKHSFIPHIATINTLVTRDLEKILINDLKKVNIPVISPIDTWDFFKFRFSPVEKETSGEELSFLPDYVLVVDSFAKERAVMEGIPEKKIIITCNPDFEKL